MCMCTHTTHRHTDTQTHTHTHTHTHTQTYTTHATSSPCSLTRKQKPCIAIHAKKKKEISNPLSMSTWHSGALMSPCSLYDIISLVQFSGSVMLTLCDPMNCSMPGLPVHYKLLEFTQTHAHRVGDAIKPSHPLLSPSPPAPNPSQHQGLFQWVNSSHEVAKVLEFQLQHHDIIFKLIMFQWNWKSSSQPGKCFYLYIK